MSMFDVNYLEKVQDWASPEGQDWVHHPVAPGHLDDDKLPGQEGKRLFGSDQGVREENFHGWPDGQDYDFGYGRQGNNVLGGQGVVGVLGLQAEGLQGAHLTPAAGKYASAVEPPDPHGPGEAELENWPSCKKFKGK